MELSEYQKSLLLLQAENTIKILYRGRKAVEAWSTTFWYIQGVIDGILANNKLSYTEDLQRFISILSVMNDKALQNAEEER